MSKQEEKGLVPERRFPEFLDAGEWQVTKLKKLAKRTTLRNIDCRVIRVLTNSAEFGIVDQRDFFDKDIAIQGNLDGYYVVEHGDYVYNPRVSTFAPVGPISKNKIGTGVMSPLYTVFRFYNSNNDFFEHYFKTAQWHTYMRFVSNSGARHDRMAITAYDFMSLPLPAPNPEEQQKIADCLTSIDRLISAQTHKLGALKTHKKGLMQQLFAVEGETEPKRRFPEFQNKGEWKLQKLEGLAKRGSGHTPNKQIPSYYNGGIKWVSLADSNKLDNRYIYTTKIEISKEGLDNSSAVLHAAGAVILSRDAGVGKSAVLHSEMAVSQHFIVWVCDELRLSNWFLYYALQILKPTFERIAVGNTIKTIGLPYFKELHISVPSINEQHKIVDCLTSIDELITAQAKKLDALKAHKKGLMQQLFPAMNEVSV